MAPVSFADLNRASPSARKIACFRALFRGRSDVYPRRFESRKSGKSGYQPACGNEWARGLCEKPKTRCSDCPNPRWLPVTDEVVRWHLSGQDPQGHPFTMGVYPMLLDETCFFVAVDFDGETWLPDVGAFAEICRQRGIPVAVERSRSGDGAHAWFFFEEAIPAILSRKLASHLLTETMERRPEVGLKSYDRLFPNQDTLPKGGFGNLIALPLQRVPRERGRSVFLAADLSPHPDQWAYLGNARRVSRAEAESVVAEAERRDRVIGVRLVPDDDFALAPWETPPSRRARHPPIPGRLPAALHLVLADQIYFEKAPLPPMLRNRLIRLAAFQNPEFYRAQAMRLTTYGKPRVIACAEDHPGHIALPRGCLDEAVALLTSIGVGVSVDDRRNRGVPLEAAFQGALRPEQLAAAEALLKHDNGVLAATTAFGKTVLAAWLIARRGVNTLVLVHRQQLLEQWIQRLSQFLGIPEKAVGRLGGGRKKLTGSLDVALIQSLVKKGVADDRVADYGHLVFDECHHLSAASFEAVARRATARYCVGLSATITRKDGHHPIIFMQCGPVRWRVDAKKQAEQRPFDHLVFARPTNFRSDAEPDDDARIEFRRLCDLLMRDPARNAMICSDVAAAIREGRCPIVLTERTEHLDHLADSLNECGIRAVVLRGAMGKRAERAAMARLRERIEGEPIAILATGKYVGEGFDEPRLDTLFLVMPVSWRGTVAQYAGRLHRLHAEKQTVVIYDYADLNLPMLSRMFDRRCAGYEAIGYRIALPASAVPGWPPEVQLPVDPGWKRDYAASVRRLIRDGLDAALADLFAVAAIPPRPGVGGIARARSAAEAFLYRRLETLGATAGRFALNAELPIPFDRRGAMEVDFICSELGLVIEIDGPQHLADLEAWRRDRKKDALLQLNGFAVLRYLAEDVAKRLDEVLDSILAFMAFRARPRSADTGLAGECWKAPTPLARDPQQQADSMR
jgi:superfamily II DNA or RNA helicase